MNLAPPEARLLTEDLTGEGRGVQKTAKIEIRVSPIERRAIELAAEENRNTLSQYVRRAALAQAEAAPFLKPDEIDSLDQLREQLRRAGINLNTLLRDLQAFDLKRHRELPEPEDFAAVHRELNDVLGQVREMLGSRI